MTNHELKALRLSLQMNQKEFADSFGVSLRTDNDDTIEDPTTEIAILRERVRYLQQLVDEKERTIQILLQQNRHQPS